MSRDRNRTTEPVLHAGQYEDWDGNLYPFSYASTRYETMFDTVVPGYHSRSRAGEIFNNPCVYRSTSINCDAEGMPQTLWLQKVTNDPTSWAKLSFGNHSAYVAYVAKRAPYQYDKNDAILPTHDVAAEAKQKCLANVDSVPYEFMEDLMEIRETIRFLKNPLASIAGIGRAFGRKRNRIRNHDSMTGDEKVKALADLWNQYRFAFAPLVRSAMTSLEAYNARDEDHRPARRSAHGRFGKSDEMTTLAIIASGISHKYQWKKTSTATIDGHAAILYEVSNPLDDWRFRLGLRSKDIPTTMWEIVPLSFMVDRIVNIRDAISGLVNLADPSISFLASSYTIRANYVHDLSCYGEYWSYGELTTTVVNPDFVRFTKFEYDRTTWSPTAPDALPTWDPGGLVKDLTKTLDLIAIAISRLL